MTALLHFARRAQRVPKARCQCIICGASFLACSPLTSTCSPKCQREKARRRKVAQRAPQRLCPHCGAPLQRNHRYCETWRQKLRYAQKQIDHQKGKQKPTRAAKRAASKARARATAQHARELAILKKLTS